MSHRRDLGETTTNMVLGLLLGYIILRLIGTPPATAFLAQGAFVAVAFLRTYLVRRLFRWLERRSTAG